MTLPLCLWQVWAGGLLAAYGAVKRKPGTVHFDRVEGGDSHSPSLNVSDFSFDAGRAPPTHPTSHLLQSLLDATMDMTAATKSMVQMTADDATTFLLSEPHMTHTDLTTGDLGDKSMDPNDTTLNQTTLADATPRRLGRDLSEFDFEPDMLLCFCDPATGHPLAAVAHPKGKGWILQPRDDIPDINARDGQIRLPSLPVECLFSVVPAGGAAVAFRSFAAGGRFLQAAGKPGELPRLSHGFKLGPAERWEHYPARGLCSHQRLREGLQPLPFAVERACPTILTHDPRSLPTSDERERAQGVTE